MKYELIGQPRTKGASLMNYKDNPWGIKVGYYGRCPTCKKVGVITLNIDSHPNEPDSRTYLYEKYRHYSGQNHVIRLATALGPRKYEWFLKNVKKITRTARGVPV